MVDPCDLDLVALQARFNAIMEQVKAVERIGGVDAGDREFNHLIAEEPTLAEAIHSNALLWATLMLGYEVAKYKIMVTELARELLLYEQMLSH